MANTFHNLMKSVNSQSLEAQFSHEEEKYEENQF